MENETCGFPTILREGSGGSCHSSLSSEVPVRAVGADLRFEVGEVGGRGTSVSLDFDVGSEEVVEKYRAVPRAVWMEVDRLYRVLGCETYEYMVELVFCSLGVRVPQILVKYHLHVNRGRLDRERGEFLDGHVLAHAVERERIMEHPSKWKYSKAVEEAFLLHSKFTKAVLHGEVLVSADSLGKLTRNLREIIDLDPMMKLLDRQDSKDIGDGLGRDHEQRALERVSRLLDAKDCLENQRNRDDIMDEFLMDTEEIVEGKDLGVRDGDRKKS